MNCKSILIIEDDSDIREAVQQVLSYEGYATFVAGDGHDGLELLVNMPEPSLILLDLMMPIMTGWEFLEALRSNPRYSNHPVVIVSAVPEGRALVPSTGLVQAEGLLGKPLNIDSLLKVIQKYCVPLRQAVTEDESQSMPTAANH